MKLRQWQSDNPITLLYIWESLVIHHGSEVVSNVLKCLGENGCKKKTLEPRRAFTVASRTATCQEVVSVLLCFIVTAITLSG